MAGCFDAEAQITGPHQWSREKNRPTLASPHAGIGIRDVARALLCADASAWRSEADSTSLASQNRGSSLLCVEGGSLPSQEGRINYGPDTEELGISDSCFSVELLVRLRAGSGLHMRKTETEKERERDGGTEGGTDGRREGEAERGRER